MAAAHLYEEGCAPAKRGPDEAAEDVTHRNADGRELHPVQARSGNVHTQVCSACGTPDTLRLVGGDGGPAIQLQGGARAAPH